MDTVYKGRNRHIGMYRYKDTPRWWVAFAASVPTQDLFADRVRNSYRVIRKGRPPK